MGSDPMTDVLIKGKKRHRGHRGRSEDGSDTVTVWQPPESPTEPYPLLGDSAMRRATADTDGV